MVEDINQLDLTFSTIQEDTKEILKEAKENYFSSLNKFEVDIIKFNIANILY